MKPLIVIAGATATGKSDLALDLAKKLDTQIISADSMQVYKYMDIGTAKIDLETRKKIEHYMIDEVEPDENFSVADYKIRAEYYLKKIYDLGKIPILCGGTGFYINAVLKNIDFVAAEKNLELEEKLSAMDIKFLRERLFEIDKKAFDLIEKNNKRKIVRAIEFFYETGKKISEHNEREKEKKCVYDVVFVVLNLKREVLYEKINLRTEKMIEMGLVDEVKNLFVKYKKDLPSLQGIGYKEIILYLEGKISLAEAVDLIKKNTRHYAKRQITWFKHQANGIWIDKNDFKNNNDLVEYVLNICKEKFAGYQDFWQ